MKILLSSLLLQLFLLLFLLSKNRNDGEKELFKKQQWKPFDLLFIILMLNLGIIAFYHLGHVDFLRQFLKSNHYLFYFILLIIIFLYFRLKFKENFSIFGLAKNNLIRNIYMGLLLGLIGYAIFRLFLLFSRPDVSSLNRIREILIYKTPVQFLIYLWYVIILAPFVEEVIFRGILYSPYRKKFGPKGGIIFTSLFFTFIHSEGGLLAIFLFAVLLGFAYEKTESIIPTFVAHSIYNLFYTLTFYFY